MFYIYRITNNVNGKTYIGKHKSKTILKDDGYMGSGVRLHSAKKHYGIKNFSKDIITTCYDNFEACVLEKYYITKERALGKAEYNIADGGEGGNTGGKGGWKKGHIPWNKGIPHSKESNEKNRQSHLGKKAWNKDRKATISERQKTSESGKGKHSHPMTEEQKKKISSAKTGKSRKPRYKVICNETGKVFESISSACEFARMGYRPLKKGLVDIHSWTYTIMYEGE